MLVAAEHLHHDPATSLRNSAHNAATNDVDRTDFTSNNRKELTSASKTGPDYAKDLWRRQSRARMYTRLGTLADITEDPRVARCARQVSSEGYADTGLRLSLGMTDYGTPVAWFDGLAQCGRTHRCPRCSAKVRHYTGSQMGDIFNATMNSGGQVQEVRLSSTHAVSDSLFALDRAIRGASAAIMQSPMYSSTYVYVKTGQIKGFKHRLGVTGWTKTHAFAYGPAGWHVHQHWSLMFARTPPADMLAKLQTSMAKTARNSLAASGFPSLEEHVMHWQPVDHPYARARYLTQAHDDIQNQVPSALTITDLRAGDFHRDLTPFELLDVYANTGDREALNLWREYEALMSGADWSTGESTGKQRRVPVIRGSNGLWRGAADDASNEEQALEQMYSSAKVLWVDAATATDLPFRLQMIDLTEEIARNGGDFTACRDLASDAGYRTWAA